jgi:hypothetical protein
MPLDDPTDCAQMGIVLAPPFDDDYECWNLGPIPNVPLEWGGLNIHPDDDDTLIVGGFSNEAQGKIYAIDIARDGDCHVLGYENANPVVFSAGEYNDGGVAFHPDSGVLFLARWPVNELGMVEPNSQVTDKIIPLGGWSVTSSLAGLNFVPDDFPGAGKLKFVTWATGDWYTVTIAPDMNGTYDITDVDHELTIVGGPEGFVYIAAENPGFDTESMLVSEWSDNKIAAYELDDDGNPDPNTRVDFVTGLTGAEGAFIDPQSGDFLFTTWGGADVLIAIRGFKPLPQ